MAETKENLKNFIRDLRYEIFVPFGGLIKFLLLTLFAFIVVIIGLEDNINNAISQYGITFMHKLFVAMFLAVIVWVGSEFGSISKQINDVKNMIESKEENK